MGSSSPEEARLLLWRCISLFLAGCLFLALPLRIGMAEALPLNQQASQILTAIASENELLAAELAKLPELQKTPSLRELNALTHILELYKQDPAVFVRAFDQMYREGKPEVRKYCTPLQALFWLAEKGAFTSQNNPLKNYTLESLLNAAWGIEGVVLPAEYVRKILAEPVYVDDKKEISAVLAKRAADVSIFDGPEFLADVQARWSDFAMVTERLNSPRLVFKYVKPNLYYPQFLRFTSGKHTPYDYSPQQTFASKIGNCGIQALFVDYCLKMAGYETTVMRYVCTPQFCGPQREKMSYTNPTPYHWTVVIKEDERIYELDAGRHYLGGEYRSLAEVAGGNPFVLRKSWQEAKRE
jgi:hypothetical protein